MRRRARLLLGLAAAALALGALDLAFPPDLSRYQHNSDADLQMDIFVDP